MYRAHHEPPCVLLTPITSSRLSQGTGKGTMLLDAMRAVEADGAAFVEAHPDLEVFRLRFGKALNYDFFEDWQGGLFSRADPRNGGPSLDIGALRIAVGHPGHSGHRN